MHGRYDSSETKDGVALNKASSGEDAEKWGCLQINLSTLRSVLCRSNWSAFANSLSRACQKTRTSEGAYVSVLCHPREEDVNIMHQTSRGEAFLLTLEALWIRELKPEINTKDEYRSRELTIKLLST